LIALAICGPGDSGKDVASVWLRDHTQLRYKESTSKAMLHVVYSRLRLEMGYENPEECYADRKNRRARWQQIISEYNQPNPTRLYARMRRDTDILNGIRTEQEFTACKTTKMFDLAIWIECDSAPPDPSLTYGKDACDVIVLNCMTPQFFERLERLANALGILST